MRLVFWIVVAAAAGGALLGFVAGLMIASALAFPWIIERIRCR